MTEQEWLDGANTPGELLACLRGRASERRLRLFAVACCRNIWHRLWDPRSCRAVEVAERFADGLATAEELAAARVLAEEAVADASAEFLRTYSRSAEGAVEATTAACDAARPSALEAATGTAASAAQAIPFPEPWKARRREQVLLLRELFGNPFRPARLDPFLRMWNGGQIPRLAAAIYEERAFERMPVLGDALEEAGCTDSDLLAHCRVPLLRAPFDVAGTPGEDWLASAGMSGGHVRGCWAVDLVLERG
jgi:hypothetical protein